MLVERKKSFNIDMFGYRVVIVLTNDIEGSVDKHANEFPPNVRFGNIAKAQALHIFHPMRPFSMVILPFNADLSTVAHEAFHVVWRVMEFVDADHENEVMAYMLGYVIEHIGIFTKSVGQPEIPKLPQEVKAIIESDDIQKRLEKGDRVVIDSDKFLAVKVKPAETG
jgi:hypothetical protein